MKNFENIELLILKQLQKVATDQDNAIANAWLSESEKNIIEYNHLRSTWELFVRLNQMQQVNIFEARKKIKSRIKDFQNSPNFWQYWQRVAAVLFIPVLLSTGLFFHFKQKSSKSRFSQEIHSAFGVRTKVNLPDGTVVWLNSGSTIKFPDLFADNAREVTLNGEAFFEVAQDKKKPFYVNLGELSVKAVGTSFNVTAYPNEKTYETTLISGDILIVKKVSKNDEIVLYKMRPNQHTVYNKAAMEIRLCENITQGNEKLQTAGQVKSLHSKSSDAVNDIINENKYTSWINGKLIFRNDSMEMIVKSLGRWYNADIILQDQRLYDFRYTATFTNETLIQVLDLLTLSAPIEYTIVERKENDDKSFTKPQINIRLKKLKN
jgi:ferric-dicitrate binding protein FerR (iron transport regulator)